MQNESFRSSGGDDFVKITTFYYVLVQLQLVVSVELFVQSESHLF